MPSRPFPATVVVTGAQGLLGRHVVAELLAGGARAVVGVGRSAPSTTHYTHRLHWLGEDVPAPLPARLAATAVDARYSYHRLDVAEAAAVDAALRRIRPDVVVHVAGALRDSPWPDLVSSNLDAVAALVPAVAAAGVPRLVLTSSGSVYGDVDGPLPLHEEGPARPSTPYGVSKRAGEDLARVLAARHGPSVVSARVFNLVGPGLDERHLPAHLANRLVAARRSPGEPGGRRVRVGPLSATRDLVDVRDAARALVALATAAVTPDLVNVASGVEVPMRRVADLLARVAGGGVRVEEEGGPRDGDISRAVADVGRLVELGAAPRVPLEESLREMVRYYEALPDPAPGTTRTTGATGATGTTGAVEDLPPAGASG